jgi:nuclear pore complex protein Nup155
MSSLVRGTGAAAATIGNENSPAAAANTSAEAARMFNMLDRARRAVELAQARDAQFPELGELVAQGQSTDYTLYNEPSWQPFARTAIINIPDPIFEHYNKTEVVTRMGLFGEIQRAYITVDNKLYLWDFMKGYVLLFSVN